MLELYAEGYPDLDRLMHRCAMLEFEGKSYRLMEAAARLAITPAMRAQSLDSCSSMSD